MRDCQKHQEKSRIIPIQQNSFRKNMNDFNNNQQYSLKQNFFDPSKSSPPNDFMQKLESRLSVYDDTLFVKKSFMLTKE